MRDHGGSSETPRCPAHHQSVRGSECHRNQGLRKSKGATVVVFLSPYQSTKEDTSLIRDFFSCSKLSMLLLFSQRDFGKREHKRPFLYRAGSSALRHCTALGWIYLEQWCNPVASCNTVQALIHRRTAKHLKGAAMPLSLWRSSDIYP